MREVEPQSVGRHERALLRNVIAQRLLESKVQEVSRRVVGADALATIVVNGKLDLVADGDRADRDLADEDVHVASGLVGVVDADLRALRDDPTGVADLAAGRAVEW